MQPDEVAASVRERIGMDVQAVGLVRARTSGGPAPRVWTVMTEHGHFWFVEDGADSEVFRAVQQRMTASAFGCHSAAEAARRFMALHPRAPTPEPAAAASPDVGETVAAARSFLCDMCGALVARRRLLDRSTRALCPRCRHAERERLRYQQDPQYRARRLAYSAARYRQSQGVGEP